MLISPTLAGFSRRWGVRNRVERGLSQAGSGHTPTPCALERAALAPVPDLRHLVGNQWVRQAAGVGVTPSEGQGGPVGRRRRPRAPSPTPRTCPGRGPKPLSRGPAPPRPGRAACWLAEAAHYANEPDPARHLPRSCGPRFGRLASGTRACDEQCRGPSW